MSKPTLLVIAGCNGSGKSTFSNLLCNKGVTPFDYDKHFLSIYNSITDSDIREIIKSENVPPFFKELLPKINSKI